MKEEERNTIAIFAGLIGLIIIPAAILGFLGMGALEYIVAILIILIIGIIFFSHQAFLR